MLTYNLWSDMYGSYGGMLYIPQLYFSSIATQLSKECKSAGRCSFRLLLYLARLSITNYIKSW